MIWTILAVLGLGFCLVFGALFVFLVVAAVRSDLAINKCLVDGWVDEGQLESEQFNTIKTREQEAAHSGLLNAGQAG